MTLVDEKDLTQTFKCSTGWSVIFFKAARNNVKVPSGGANVYKGDDWAYDSYYPVSTLMGTAFKASCASQNLSHIYVKIRVNYINRSCG